MFSLYMKVLQASHQKDGIFIYFPLVTKICSSIHTSSCIPMTLILDKANQPTEAEMHMALGFNSSPQVGMSDTECIMVSVSYFSTRFTSPKPREG